MITRRFHPISVPNLLLESTHIAFIVNAQALQMLQRPVEIMPESWKCVALQLTFFALHTFDYLIFFFT